MTGSALPENRWWFPPASTADESGLLAVGADLEPATIIDAYRLGIFPMPLKRDGPIGWWSPDPRGTLEPSHFHESRSLTRSHKRFETRVDTAFALVLEGCADPSRPHGWIDDQIRLAYLELFNLGWAHSIETWTNGELVGGLYGLCLGKLFAAESKFHRVRDASKAAVASLCDLLGDDGLIDVQWLTPHLASLGAAEMQRDRYLERISALVEIEQTTF
ncbi:MAG: leucyl/phenylalanyl-tRNA--protein transferase [Acidobacteria bacterium]|nr:leucyl/phenylalanyl-tRNA--protein transferase [Acidobacteriota bacterium]